MRKEGREKRKEERGKRKEEREKRIRQITYKHKLK